MWSTRVLPFACLIPAVACAVLMTSSGSSWAQAGRVMAIEDQPGYVPDARDEQLPAAYQRQAVFYRSNEPPGTIIVDTADRYLYLIQGNNRAIRYGIGVGREGFQWQGLLKGSR